MDAVTHVLAGYVLGLSLFWRTPHRVALAATTAAAALAPDLDVLVAPLAFFDAFYWAGHRGMSHSLLGAPLFAWTLVLLLARLSHRWPRLAVFRRRRWRWLAVLVGAWSQLLMDGITHLGVPWAWPVTDARWGLEWYFWMVLWLAPISLVPLWKRFRGAWDDPTVLRAAAVVVVILLVVGGLRLANRPLPDEGDVFSRPDPFEWTVVRQHGNGTFQAALVLEGTALDTAWYVQQVPEEAAAAVAAARASLAFRAFAFQGFGHYAWSAGSAGDGWNVTVLDVVERFELRDRPAWRPVDWLEGQGRLRLHVGDDGLEVLDRRW